MDDRGNLSNMEIITNIKFSIIENCFSIGTVFVFCIIIIGMESFLEMFSRTSNFFSEISTSIEVFH